MTIEYYKPAAIDLISKWTSPFTPSAQISILLMSARSFAVGQTFGSSAQVTVCSPVAGLQWSLNMLKGIFTSENSSPTLTEYFALKQPPERGLTPPLAQEYSGDMVPAAIDILNPV